MVREVVYLTLNLTSVLAHTTPTKSDPNTPLVAFSHEANDAYHTMRLCTKVTYGAIRALLHGATQWGRATPAKRVQHLPGDTQQHTKGTRYTHPMLVRCRASVADDGATLNQHWVSVSCCMDPQCSRHWSSAGSTLLLRWSNAMTTTLSTLSWWPLHGDASFFQVFTIILLFIFSCLLRFRLINLYNLCLADRAFLY